MNSIPQTSGIYMITCTANGRIYIGSTFDIRARWLKHRRQLRAGTHHNLHLQRAWDKYGEQGFSFEVLEFVMSFALLEKEQGWLDKLKPFGNRGFNLSKVAGAPMKGKHHSNETKAKLSASSKGRSAWNKGIPSARKGVKMDIDAVERMAATKRGRPLSLQALAAASEVNAKEYILTNPDGIEMCIKDLGRFCREHGLNSSGVYHIVNKNKTYRGWKCRHA